MSAIDSHRIPNVNLRQPTMDLWHTDWQRLRINSQAGPPREQTQSLVIYMLLYVVHWACHSLFLCVNISKVPAPALHLRLQPHATFRGGADIAERRTNPRLLCGCVQDKAAVTSSTV